MNCFEQNLFKTKNKTNSFGLYFKFIFIFLFLILIGASPVSVFAAGAFDGGVTEDGKEAEDNIIMNINEQRINEYCSFVSWPSFDPEAKKYTVDEDFSLIEGLGINTNQYSSYSGFALLDLPDERAAKVETVTKSDGTTELRAYASLVDPKSGSRTGHNLVSETVQEFQGSLLIKEYDVLK